MLLFRLLFFTSYCAIQSSTLAGIDSIIAVFVSMSDAWQLAGFVDLGGCTERAAGQFPAPDNFKMARAEALRRTQNRGTLLRSLRAGCLPASCWANERGRTLHYDSWVWSSETVKPLTC